MTMVNSKSPNSNSIPKKHRFEMTTFANKASSVMVFERKGELTTLRVYSR